MSQTLVPPQLDAPALPEPVLFPRNNPHDITATGETDLESAPNRLRLTREMAQLLEDQGLLKHRYELINGELVPKMGQNPPHILTLIIVTEWLRQLYGGLHIMQQGSMKVLGPAAPIHEPQPDVAVLEQTAFSYADRLAQPSDVVLLVEVSDSTARFDLGTKAKLFGREGVREYWVVDVQKRRIVVHREPGANGYAQVVSLGEQDTIAPHTRSTEGVLVSTLLPPVAPDPAMPDSDMPAPSAYAASDPAQE